MRNDQPPHLRSTITSPCSGWLSSRSTKPDSSAPANVPPETSTSQPSTRYPPPLMAPTSTAPARAVWNRTRCIVSVMPGCSRVAASASTASSKRSSISRLASAGAGRASRCSIKKPSSSPWASVPNSRLPSGSAATPSGRRPARYCSAHLSGQPSSDSSDEADSFDRGGSSVASTFHTARPSAAGMISCVCSGSTMGVEPRPKGGAWRQSPVSAATSSSRNLSRPPISSHTGCSASSSPSRVSNATSTTLSRAASSGRTQAAVRARWRVSGSSTSTPAAANALRSDVRHTGRSAAPAALATKPHHRTVSNAPSTAPGCDTRDTAPLIPSWTRRAEPARVTSRSSWSSCVLSIRSPPHPSRIWESWRA